MWTDILSTGYSLRRVAGFVLLIGAALTLGCISIGDASTAIPRAKQAEPAFDRINCEEIAGTAFRSDSERTWYNENCSRWPLVNVPEGQGGGNRGVTQQQQPPECAAMRGKPYTSNDQRDWYLKNCQGTPANPQTQSPPGAGDRTNCDEIRGTSYRSAGERDWFLKNCPASGPVQTSGPDRTNCNEIRGTAYRSNTERDWYNRNCSGASTNPGNGGGGNQQQQPIVIIRPSNGDNSNGNGRGRN